MRHTDAFHGNRHGNRHGSVTGGVGVGLGRIAVPMGGNMRNGPSAIESRDLYVLVETLLNQAKHDPFNDPVRLSAEIETVIWFAAQLYGGDFFSTSTLDAARSLLRMGRRVTALQEMKGLLVLRGALEVFGH